MPAPIFNVVGDDKIKKMFDDLPSKLQRKILSTAIRNGCKDIQAEAKRLCPVDTGRLRKSIRVRVAKYKRRGQVKLVVTTGAGDNLFEGRQYYGAFVEYGYRHGKATRAERRIIEKKHKADGQYLKDQFDKQLADVSDRKQIPAQPFLRPAFDTRRDAVLRSIAKQVAEATIKEATVIAK